MGSLKIIPHGDDVAIVIPRDVAAAIGLRAGDEAAVEKRASWLEVRASGQAADEASETLRVARKVMDHYDVALRALAK